MSHISLNEVESCRISGLLYVRSLNGGSLGILVEYLHAGIVFGWRPLW